MRGTRLHASAVVWREDGILIRGPSGFGKSTLAAAFVVEGRRHQVFARLVADDIVVLNGTNGRLVARPPASVAGLIERRGIGILPVDHEPACVVRMVVDLAEKPTRLPDPSSCSVEILEVMLPRLILAKGAPASDNVYRALDFLAAFRARS